MAKNFITHNTKWSFCSKFLREFAKKYFEFFSKNVKTRDRPFILQKMAENFITHNTKWSFSSKSLREFAKIFRVFQQKKCKIRDRPFILQKMAENFITHNTKWSFSSKSLREFAKIFRVFQQKKCKIRDRPFILFDMFDMFQFSKLWWTLRDRSNQHRKTTAYHYWQNPKFLSKKYEAPSYLKILHWTTNSFHCNNSTSKVKHCHFRQIHLSRINTRNFFLYETVINLNGSVSYIFLNFGWFSFLIFPISYGLRFLNFSDIFFKIANASLFQKNLNFFLY